MIGRIKILTLLTVLLTGIIFGLIVQTDKAYAADTFLVSADISNSEVMSDNQYLIPIIIKKNKGIMGFRINLEYDKKDVSIISISKGLITAKGNFMSDIDNKVGKSEAIWNNVSQITDDKGSLFYIVAKTNSNNCTIKMSYSKEDTFNEKYQDVYLECKDIEINLNDFKEDALEIKEDTIEDSGNNTNDKITNNTDINIDNNVDSTSIKSEEEARRGAISEYAANSKNPLLSDNMAIENFKNHVVDELNTNGYKNLVEVPDDKKDKIIKSIKDSLLSDGIDVDEQFIRDGLEDISIKDLDTKNTGSKKNNLIMIGIIIVISVFVSVVIIIFLKLKKKKMEDGNEN